MATAISETEYYTPVNDPIYNVLNKSIAVDKDTARKQTREIPASGNGGTGDVTNALNGQKTTFQWSNGSNYKFRWDTSRLEFDIIITKTAKTADNALCIRELAPSWNMAGALIDSMSLRINGSSTELYNSGGSGDYLYDFTSRLLKYYTLEELEKMDHFLFTPICAEREFYINDLPADAKFQLPFGYAEGEELRQITMRTATTAGIAVPELTGGGAYQLKVGVASEAYFSEPNFTAAKMRSKKYVDTTSSVRKITIAIPFCDLFPRIQGIAKNIRSVDLTINWSSVYDHLERSTTYVANTHSHGSVNIVSSRIVLDEYVYSTGQSMEGLNEKIAGEVDHISMLVPVVYRRPWAGSDIIITSIKNLESIMIMQIARGCSATSLNVDPYLSYGQFLLGNGGNTAGDNLSRSDALITGTMQHVPTSIQIIYGSTQYPNTAISLRNGNIFNSTPIYYEYLKAIGKVSDRINGSPLSKEYFSGTMPFIYLKPWSTNGVHLNQAEDLIIKMPTANAPTVEGNKYFHFIVYQLQSFKIAVDGSVSAEK